MSETEKTKFDPSEHLIELQKKKYLPVAARIAWFRAECPIEAGWGIRTELVAGSLKENFATFHAEILDPEGRVVSAGTKTEDKTGFPDFLEKSETGSIGRALAAAGFGTLFALELDEGTERLADTPAAPRTVSGNAKSAICSICNDASKPVAAARASFCVQKSQPISHLECSRGQS